MRRLTVGFAALMLTTALAGATMAPAAGPKAYVGLFKDDAVAVIDVTQNRVLSTIPVPKGPHGLVITPDGRKVYVSSDGASTVSVIDTGKDAVVATIDVGANPHGLAMSRDGRKVLVSGFGSDRVLVIDTASEKVTGEVAVPQVHNGAISPDGSRAWVGSQKQGETAIYVIDLQTMKRVGSLALDKTPRALDTSPDGKRVYFTNGLYRAWDGQFYPDGIKGWLVKVDADPKGGIKLDPKFFLPADEGYRTHQIRLEGGDSSSDTFCYP